MLGFYNPSFFEVYYGKIDIYSSVIQTTNKTWYEGQNIFFNYSMLPASGY